MRHPFFSIITIKELCSKGDIIRAVKTRPVTLSRLLVANVEERSLSEILLEGQSLTTIWWEYGMNVNLNSVGYSIVVEILEKLRM